MTATTPRYDLTYPTGTDQVADTPTIFKNMADSVENALGEVDDRHTNAAVMPVVRPSLMQLQQATAITGQTGYVTDDGDDGDNTGMYVWTGTSWLRIVDSPMIEASTTLTKITTDSLYVTTKILDQGINCIGFDNTALIIAQIEWINNGQFTSKGWVPVDLFKFTGYTSIREAFGWCFDNNSDGPTNYDSTFKCVGKTVSWVAKSDYRVDARCWHQGGVIIPVTKDN